MDNKDEQQTLELYDHFIEPYRKIGPISLYPAKMMISIPTPERRIDRITALGKNFVHVVFPFFRSHDDNLYFKKIVPVPGDGK